MPIENTTPNVDKSKDTDNTTIERGPIAGILPPVFGGTPTTRDCSGCSDCCRLFEISVTDEEAATLVVLHQNNQITAPLRLSADTEHEGWQKMQGPCVFLAETPLGSGCSIYEERPSSCRIFTCKYQLDLRRVW